MKPLWYVEQDSFGWVIYCRFMLAGKRAGLAEIISNHTMHNSADKASLVSDAIEKIARRHESFAVDMGVTAHA